MRTSYNDYTMENKKKSAAEKTREWYRNNKEYCRLKRRERYLKNKERDRALVKQYLKDNPHKIKQYNLKSNYGITLQTFKEMLKNQDNKCAVCKRLFEKESDACVDHCHKTGKIRGLLHSNCNRAIGLFEENIETLKNTIEYLKGQE